MNEPVLPIPDKIKAHTYKFLKWIFALIFLYIVVSILWLFLTKPQYVEQIVTLSIGGFIAFFMGYFGWRGGMIVEEHFIKLSKK